MEICNEQPIDFLYKKLKTLKIPIYLWIMNEDENSIPKSYILLRSDITDTARNYADGVTKVRQSDCDIVLVSKGAVTSSSNVHMKNIKKIKDLFNAEGIPYSCYDLGFDKNFNSTQFTFSTTVNYYV